ncbi:MAG: sulfurtransferase complex subunit TusC [Buchnera aphidicola (Meitanaphis microgallis)]
MKSIAFIFSHVPYGTSLSREGLDSVLSISMINQNIAIFFIGDGVLQLVKNQKPSYILSHDHVSSFGILPFFGINKFYYCEDSLKERGLFCKRDFFLDIFIINRICIRKELEQYNLIISF